MLDARDAASYTWNITFWLPGVLNMGYDASYVRREIACVQHREWNILESLSVKRVHACVQR